VSIQVSGEQSGLNKKIVAVILMVFMSIAVALIPFSNVHGQNSLGVSIITVVPASEANSLTQLQSVFNGSAGELYNLKGTIYTSNGTFNVLMGNTIVGSGTSNGYYVDTNFTVPQLPGGDYTFAIEDVRQQDLNSTGSTPEQFLILSGYTINPSTTYNQEGSTVGLTAEVTGGEPGLSYSANVTVVLPSPLNGNFSQQVTMVANNVGTASEQINFPSGNFQSGDSLQLGGLSPTDFAGNYTLYFNMTGDLAQNQFTVGFLDSATYHRSQTATVVAQGYSAGQTATLTATNVETGTSLYPAQSLTADANGVISSTFSVPNSAAVGSFQVTITTTSGNAKLIQDSQTFYVLGYPVTITTLNLNGQAVSNILVQVQDENANTFYNASSDSNGLASFNLEPGSYNLTAYWLGAQKIGQTSIKVTGPGSFNFECQLTNLQITVLNEKGTTLPFVNLAISYTYGSSQTENVSAETDSSGNYLLNSTLSGVSYTIRASLYGQVFNAGNETINIPVLANYQVVIVCPTEPVTLTVVDYNGAPISGANVQLVELTNGLFYSGSTDSSGSANAQLTFGMYKLQIYENGILINQTTINATIPGQYSIHCTLYGIQVSVSVIDYFGDPISNANVTLNGPSAERFSAMTNGAGKTTFTDVVGGNMQIVAFPKGAESSYQALSLTVDQPASVQIKMDGYVTLGGLLVTTTALMTLILVIVAIVLLVVVEMFLRLRRRTASEN